MGTGIHYCADRDINVQDNTICIVPFIHRNIAISLQCARNAPHSYMHTTIPIFADDMYIFIM